MPRLNFTCMARCSMSDDIDESNERRRFMNGRSRFRLREKRRSSPMDVPLGTDSSTVQHLVRPRSPARVDGGVHTGQPARTSTYSRANQSASMASEQQITAAAAAPATAHNSGPDIHPTDLVSEKASSIAPSPPVDLARCISLDDFQRQGRQTIW